LSGIIINNNLQLLLINYLAPKVDVLFRFPSRSQYTWDRTYGRTVYISESAAASAHAMKAYTRPVRKVNIHHV